MKLENTELVVYEFTKLTDQDITEIDNIFKFWYRKNRTEEEINKGLYINDHIDFNELRKVKYQGQGIGRIFCLEDKGIKLAYILSFDTLDFTEKRENYLKLLTPFVKADRSFIYNIIYLDQVAFIFHVGISPKHQYQELGRKLLNMVMDFYVDTGKTRLVASTLDSGQIGMIRMLEKERPTMVFLNQEFSEQNNKEIRVRVAELIDVKTFRKKINDSYLQRTYDFVIPMQLNIAIESVNRMLDEACIPAKILWTSFFHNVPELTTLNNINQFYHGFYQPIRESAQDKWVTVRQQQIQTLRNISDYLKQKHEKDSQKTGVASLIPSMEKQGFEFFFINDDPDNHDFSHFPTPKVYQLFDEGALTEWLSAAEFYTEEEHQFLKPEEKLAWYGALSKLVKALIAADEETQARRLQEWEVWRNRLCINTKENEQLLDFQRQVLARKDQKIPNFGKLVKKINTRALVPQRERERWRNWFKLHEELFESDTMLRTEEEKQKTWWCHGVVPISFTQGLSGVMFTFTCEKPLEPKSGKEKMVSSLADIIANSLSRNILNIVNKLYINNFKTALSRFKTAALSARNLSHNVGSHVFSFLSQPNELQEIIWGDAMPEDIPSGFAGFDGVKNLTTFFDFTKVRMSLLADMATNEPVASTTEWLKDNLLTYFTNQKILKKYIKGNSKRDVVVNFCNLDIKQEEGEDEEDWHFRQQNTDVLIQVPNGVLGKSAFLMIMVNFLRNSIKYAPFELDGGIELTLMVKSAEKSNRLYSLTLHDNVERDKEEASEIIKTINDKYIRRDGLYDDEFRLVQEGLGFSEMVAAARYLRKRPFRNSWVMPSFKQEIFLNAVFIPLAHQDNRGSLGVEFYLKRPRPLLIIDDIENWSNYHERVDELNAEGIKVRFTNELKGWNLESFAHEIAIVLCQELPEQIRTTRAFTPRMVLTEDANSWRSRFQKKDDTKKLVADVWNIWMMQFQYRHKESESWGPLVITNPDKRNRVASKTMLYDDHGWWLKDRSEEDIGKGSLLFYEFFRHHTGTGLLIEHLGKEETPEEEKNKFNFLLEEAASTKVVIIDERIQQMLRMHTFGKEINLEQSDAYAYLRGMNIHVPDPNAAENPDFKDPTTFRHEQQKLIDYLRRVQQDNRADFVVIHIGLIETMLGNSSTLLIDDWINTFLPAIVSTEYVMISGRGKPMAIPEHFRYLPYNSVSRVILDDCPSKYELCQNLYSSRTRT